MMISCRHKASQTKTLRLILSSPTAHSVVSSDVAEWDEGFEKSSITKHSLGLKWVFSKQQYNTFYQGGSKHIYRIFRVFTYLLFFLLFFYWIIHFICINFYLVQQHYLQCLWPRFLAVFSFVTRKYLFPYWWFQLLLRSHFYLLSSH